MRISRDKNAGTAGFFIGVLLWLLAVGGMLYFPVRWAFTHLIDATTIGAGIGYGIALVFFVIITIYVAILGMLLPAIGADW